MPRHWSGAAMCYWFLLVIITIIMVFTTVDELMQLEPKTRVDALLRVVSCPSLRVTQNGKNYVVFWCTDANAKDCYDPANAIIPVQVWCGLRDVTEFTKTTAGQFFYCRRSLVDLKYKSQETQLKCYDDNLLTFFDTAPDWLKQ